METKPILIVEDDPDIRSGLQQFFKGEGYGVLLAKDGQEALDILLTSSQPKPGLILLDLSMPAMDGPTFLVELKKNHPEIFDQIPIFITTAGGNTSRLTVKPTGVLKKPFDLSELSQVAARYCM